MHFSTIIAISISVLAFVSQSVSAVSESSVNYVAASAQIPRLLPKRGVIETVGAESVLKPVADIVSKATTPLAPASGNKAGSGQGGNTQGGNTQGGNTQSRTKEDQD